MNFIEKLWSKKKEIATTAAVSTILATGAAAESAKHETKPVEKTEATIVSETGMPSQEINLQKNLNEMAGDSVETKKLNEIKENLIDSYKNQIKAIKDRINRAKADEELGDEEEISRRGKRVDMVALNAKIEEINQKIKNDEIITKEAQAILDDVKAEETRIANMTPEEKAKLDEQKKQEAEEKRLAAQQEAKDNLSADLQAYFNDWGTQMMVRGADPKNKEDFAMKKGNYKMELQDFVQFLLDNAFAKFKANGRLDPNSVKAIIEKTRGAHPNIGREHDSTSKEVARVTILLKAAGLY